MTEQQLYYKNNLSILQDIVCLVEIKGGTLLLENCFTCSVDTQLY